MRKRVFFLALVSGILASCGTAVTNNKKTYTDTTDTSGFSVVAFYPASGTVAALPPTVTVAFSAVPHQPLARALTHYNVNCGGETLTVTAVDTLGGFASVALTMPTFTGLASGTVCTLAISPNVIDQAGNRLSGVRTVSFTLSP